MQNLFFISESIPERYPIINNHYTWVKIHKTLSFEEFSKEYNKYKPLGIYTYGNISETLNNTLSKVYSIRKIWIHLNNLNDVDATPNVFSGILGHEYDDDIPLISVITTTYKSGNKIYRPLNSLLHQHYTNWEWIIWDDSDDNSETYNNLLKIKDNDLRIRVFKAPNHSGVIGEMKRMACGLADGKFLVELDHDDDIHENLFNWIIDASKKYPEANFFYTDCIELTEETFQPISYGNFFGLGYGGHSTMWIPQYKAWLNRNITLPCNLTSIQHIVGVPNHVRVWKTSFYDSIGKHNSKLSVADDYELLIRSFVSGKWCYIPEVGYYQYRNKDGNFTFIRNSLIQHNSYYIYNYYKKLFPPHKNIKVPTWKINDNEYDEYKQLCYVYDPYPHIKNIIMINPTINDIKEEIKDNVKLYIMGQLPDNIEETWKSKIQYWNLDNEPNISLQEKINYAKKILAYDKDCIVRINTNLDSLFNYEKIQIEENNYIFYDEYNNLINLKDYEYPEQQLAMKYISDDSIVLELGARYGTVSCIINKQISNPNNMIVVEPDERVWNALEKNMYNNNCKFNIVKGFISRKSLNLINKDGGSATTSIVDDKSTINIYTLEEIEEKYNLHFNTLVADCEGFLEQFLDENPKLYSQLKMIFFEKDYPNKCNYNKIINNLIEHKFKNIVSGFHDIWIKD